MKIIGGPAALSGDLWRVTLLGVLVCTTMGAPYPHGCSATPATLFAGQRAPGTWVVAPQLRFGLLPASLYWRARFGCGG